LPGLRAAVRSGTCRFSPAQVVIKANGQEVALRSAAEAFVPKRLAPALQDRLPVQRVCNHVKGHGGHQPADRHARDWVAGGGASMPFSARATFVAVARISMICSYCTCSRVMSVEKHPENLCRQDRERV
jgi:hypothetical protein